MHTFNISYLCCFVVYKQEEEPQKRRGNRDQNALFMFLDKVVLVVTNLHIQMYQVHSYHLIVRKQVLAQMHSMIQFKLPIRTYLIRHPQMTMTVS